ncbi:MAG: ABC transporter substrate-binding protein [Actinobacteria bacterium]|nr:ABC transporter substrate-binding protein [Actinomycetota bacterium]
MCGSLLVALGLAACGSGSSTGTDSTAAAGSATEAAASKPAGEPIKLMAMEAYTEPASGLEDPHFDAGQARVEAVNAAGGIDGRPLELIKCDTKSDPNLAAACARQAVEEEVVAVVGPAVFNATSAYPILEKAGISQVGGSAADQVEGSSPISFPFTSTVTQIAGVPRALVLDGAKKMGAIIPKFPGSEQVVQGLEQLVPHLGIELGEVEQLPFDTVDFAPAVAKALSGGADSVLVFFPGPNQATAIKAVKERDPSAKVGTLNVYVTPEVIEALGPDAEGLVAAAAGLPASASSPGMDEFNAEMDKYAPETPRVDGAVFLWAAVYAVEGILKQVQTIDAKAVTAALGKQAKLETGGIIPPLDTTVPGPVPGFPRVFNPTTVPVRIEAGEAQMMEPKNPFFDPFGGPPPSAGGAKGGA